MVLKPQVFKANDIRGLVSGDDIEWDLAGARALGGAYVRLLGLSGGTFLIGRDMRHLGAELAAAFADGAMAAGASVIDIGLSSTDQLWFASGWLELPGVQFTASHNPASYNGVKFCLAGAAPVPEDFTRRLSEEARAESVASPVRGGYATRDLLDEYARYLRQLVPIHPGRRLRVVVDAGNGMAGHTVGGVFAGLNVELIGLYLELDGSFPNHPANPLDPANLVDAQRAVVEHGADLALVFDGDADRCFIIDQNGDVVDPSLITALIASAELNKHPGSAIVINTITSAGVARVVRERGGRLVTSKVGHTYVKAAMAAHDAVFGGEHSAHYYFREFWGADTGMLAALHVLAMLASSQASLSELVANYDSYVRSGEINSAVADPDAVIAALAARFSGRAEITFEDGLMARRMDDGQLRWWLNVRPSNTEPLLRLNVEALDEPTMSALRDEALTLIEETR
ncbi:MAG: phosphomannomutase/phosphoglucomutase [Propionibacteriaceae bacterium]|nr:phosphomannomutase/phosphoglucomutase [Propionibacteriaceae bacterium]